MVEDEEVIIFNDLRRRGFKMVDRKMGLDAAHTLLVLREIGRLHAVSVLVQSKLRESLNDKYNFLIKELKDSEYFFIFMETATLRMSYIMEKIGGCQNLVTWARDFAPKCSNAYWELTRRSDPFDVLCHGDCWLNNFLFRYNECGAPVDVILLDFQQCCLTSPGIDLNFFMYSSFDGAYRRDNLPTFLKAYYESFSSVLEAGGSALPYSSEELLLEYRRKNLFGFLTGLYVVPLAMCVDENVTDLSEVMDGGLEAFRKEKNERFIRQLENNPLLKTRLISLFDDLIEHGLIQ
ncbi:uncharacterized protein [Procambarus clarkii]|uniref:uncharacterized protein n=1 Tax=Procambarus clarkii TaxID=6728 RepID=UPI003742085A